MPEVVLEVESDTGNAEPGADVNYRKTTNLVLFDGTDLSIGNNNDKTPIPFGVACKWKPDTVPLDATLTGLSLEMMPAQTNSSSFTARVEVLALDSRLNAAQSKIHQIQAHAYMSTALFSLESAWADDRASGDTDDDTTVERYRSVANGIGGIGQAWTPIDDAVTRTLNAVYFKMRQVDSPSSDLVMTAYLYESTGAAGSRVRGDLVATSTSRTADELPTTAAPFVFSFSSPHTIETGVNYYTEVRLTGSGGAGQVDFRVVSTADGSTDNMEILSREDIGDRDLNGFHSSLYLHGKDIDDDASVGTVDSFTPPSFTSGALQEWGFDDIHEAILSPDQSLPNTFAALKTVVGSRTDIAEDRVAIRLYDFVGSTANSRRMIHSTNSATTTRTSPDKFGMLMILRWNEPQPIGVSGSTGTVERVYHQADSEVVEVSGSTGTVARVYHQAASESVEVSGSTGTVEQVFAQPADLHAALEGSAISQVAVLGSAAHGTMTGSGESAHDTLKGGNK